MEYEPVILKALVVGEEKGFETSDFCLLYFINFYKELSWIWRFARTP